MRQLLGGQLPGMDAAAMQAAPNPAIAAGAAPPGAPWNGTSGQPAPATGGTVVTGPPSGTKD